MKYLLPIIFFTALITMNVSAQVPAKTIPDFNFLKLDKSEFSNKNLEAGKMVFIVFFDTDCDHCQHAAMNLSQHYTDYKKAAIYLISTDDPSKMNGFINKYAPNLKGKQNVTLLHDTKNEFMNKFKPRKYPAMFLYSADKKLVDYEDNEESMFRISKQINSPVK